MIQTITIHGDVRYEIWAVETLALGPDGWPRGRPLHAHGTPNLVVNTGLTMVRDRMKHDSPVTAPSQLALGTSNTPAAVGNTGLGTQVWIAPLTRAQPGPPGTVGQAIYQYFLPSTAANGHTLREAALYNTASGGAATMLARYILTTAIAKTTAIAVTFTWRITFSV